MQCQCLMRSLDCGEWLDTKNITVSFREGSNEYFGKKGMSLPIDVLFTKNIESILQK